MPTTLLLADESPTIRKIVELTFAESDVRVESAATGGEALALLERLEPDLLLVDTGLDAPDGYELCRRVKASPRPVPVGLLVSTFEHVDLARMTACGADGKLTKPFESAALVEWVHTLLSAEAGGVPAATSETQAATSESTGELAGDAAGVPGRAETEAETPATPEEMEYPVSRGDALALSDELVDAVARRVVERLSVEAIREIAREVIPEVASDIVRERIRELEEEDARGPRDGD